VVSILGAIVVPGLVESPVHMTPGAPLEFSFREPVRAIVGKSGNWQLENELQNINKWGTCGTIFGKVGCMDFSTYLNPQKHGTE